MKTGESGRQSCSSRTTNRGALTVVITRGSHRPRLGGVSSRICVQRKLSHDPTSSVGCFRTIKYIYVTSSLKTQQNLKSAAAKRGWVCCRSKRRMESPHIITFCCCPRRVPCRGQCAQYSGSTGQVRCVELRDVLNGHMLVVAEAVAA